MSQSSFFPELGGNAINRHLPAVDDPTTCPHCLNRQGGKVDGLYDFRRSCCRASFLQQEMPDRRPAWMAHWKKIYGVI